MLNFPSSTPHSGTIEKVRAVRQEEKKIKQIKKRRKKKKKLPSNNNGIMIPTDSFVHHYHHSNPNPIGTYIRRDIVLDTLMMFGNSKNIVLSNTQVHFIVILSTLFHITRTYTIIIIITRR